MLSDKMKRYPLLQIALLIILFLSIPSFAQEGRYGQYHINKPPSDLERAGIHGKVRKVVSYEGMAKRTNKGVVFSEDPLKIVTFYNKDGNITSQITYRYGKMIEKSVYAYDAKGQKLSMKTIQSNGVTSSTIRFFYDPKTMLNTQQNSYNYSGKLTQKSIFTYNANNAVIQRVDYNGNGVKDEVLDSYYDMENRLINEKDYRYIGGSMLLYYEVKYGYNHKGSMTLYDHNMLDNFTGKYERTIMHFRYYQYDKADNWCICCKYYNALEEDKRLVPNTIVVREFTYY